MHVSYGLEDLVQIFLIYSLDLLSVQLHLNYTYSSLNDSLMRLGYFYQPILYFGLDIFRDFPNLSGFSLIVIAFPDFLS